MGATGPAARSTLPFHKLLLSLFDSLDASLGLFCRCHPADPFIARKRSDLSPCSLNCSFCLYGLFKVGGNFMNRTSNYLFFHFFILNQFFESESDIIVCTRPYCLRIERLGSLVAIQQFLIVKKTGLSFLECIPCSIRWLS